MSLATSAAPGRRSASPTRPLPGPARPPSALPRTTNDVPGAEVAFDQLTEPTHTPRKAFELLETPIPLRIM